MAGSVTLFWVLMKTSSTRVKLVKNEVEPKFVSPMVPLTETPF